MKSPFQQSRLSRALTFVDGAWDDRPKRMRALWMVKSVQCLFGARCVTPLLPKIFARTRRAPWASTWSDCDECFSAMIRVVEGSDDGSHGQRRIVVRSVACEEKSKKTRDVSPKKRRNILSGISVHGQSRAEGARTTLLALNRLSRLGDKHATVW